MPRHLEREIDTLKKKILALGARVEEALWNTIRSLEEGNSLLAEQVIDNDPEIDQQEVDVEEECLKILALHQPVAGDLRYIVCIFKINNDLERIGDLAVNIAERSVFLAGQNTDDIPFDFHEMGRAALQMVRSSLDALVNIDSELAREVCSSDDYVDDLNRQMYDLVKNQLREMPDRTDALIHLLNISRHLERIADLATNIAEDVIYLVEGVIVRHKPERYKS